MDRAHRPARVWWAPWRRHCSCGARRWPCPDTLTTTTPPPAYWLSLRNTKAHWHDEPVDQDAPPPGGPEKSREESTKPRTGPPRQRRQQRW